MKLKFKIKNLKKFKKPYIYEDEKYLRWQRYLIIIGLPLLVVSLIIYFFLNPQLPLKSVLWGSALGSAGYIMAVSMVREGTRRFWIIFLSIVILNTIFIISEDPKAEGVSYLSIILGVLVLILFLVLFLRLNPEKNDLKQNESIDENFDK